MSLNFVHNVSDYVNHSSDTSLDDLNPVTIMVWAKPDALVASTLGRNLIVNKQTASDEGLSYIFGGNTGTPNFTCNRQSNSTWFVHSAPNANFSVWGTNKWLFGACVMDFGSEGRLLLGDLTTAPAEPSSYSISNVGTGNMVTDAADDLYVGNGRTLLARFGFGGDIDRIHIVNKNLSNKQIIAQWRKFHRLPETVLLVRYGEAGTGTQVDRSGNKNNGTVTTATLSNPAPLLPFDYNFTPNLPYEVVTAGTTVPLFTNNYRRRMVQ